jgi:hypothetical protein
MNPPAVPLLRRLAMPRTGLPITNEVRIWVIAVNGQTMLHVEPSAALVGPDTDVTFIPVGLVPGQYIEIEPKHGGRWQRVTGLEPERLVLDGPMPIHISSTVGARCEYCVYLYDRERDRIIAEKDPEFFICD